MSVGNRYFFFLPSITDRPDHIHISKKKKLLYFEYAVNIRYSNTVSHSCARNDSFPRSLPHILNVYRIF
jgi:hypothetical protein